MYTYISFLDELWFNHPNQKSYRRGKVRGKKLTFLTGRSVPGWAHQFATLDFEIKPPFAHSKKSTLQELKSGLNLDEEFSAICQVSVVLMNRGNHVSQAEGEGDRKLVEESTTTHCLCSPLSFCPFHLIPTPFFSYIQEKGAFLWHLHPYSTRILLSCSLLRASVKRSPFFFPHCFLYSGPGGEDAGSREVLLPRSSQYGTLQKVVEDEDKVHAGVVCVWGSWPTGGTNIHRQDEQ